MKHIKRFNENDNWAVPNRLGGGEEPIDNIHRFIKEYNWLINRSSTNDLGLEDTVCVLLNEFDISQENLTKIVSFHVREIEEVSILVNILNNYRHDYDQYLDNYK